MAKRNGGGSVVVLGLLGLFVAVAVVWLGGGEQGSRYVTLLPALQERFFRLEKAWLPSWPIYALVMRLVDFLEFVQHLLVPPPLLLLRHASSYMPSASLYAATQLRIAEALREGPKPLRELASELGVHEPYLLRLLRALESIGVFQEVEGENGSRWRQTPMSSLLDRSHPQSQAHAVLMLGAQEYAAYGHLDQALRKGKSAFELIYGQKLWAYNLEHPEDQAIFDGSMTDLSRLVNYAIALDVDFSRFRSLADIGGGHGALLSSILEVNPNLEKGILFDQEVVIQQAKQQWEGKPSRIQFTPGSFFEPPLPTAEAYILKQIAHDWSDDEVVAILKNIRSAMGNNPNATVFIADRVLHKKGTVVSTQASGFIDLLMLVTFGDARERYAEDFKQILEKAGFEFVRITPTRSSFSIVEGRNRV